MTTNGLTAAQQQAVLSQISLANATGTLTTSQMTNALITKTRNEADAKALLLNSGLISSETAEANATNIVTSAKLRELVATGKITQAEAHLLATKAGITLANQKEASSFALSGNKIKNFGNSLLALAKTHPIILLATTGITLLTTAITIAEKKNEDFIKSQEKHIEKIDKNISKYDDEISSLDTLQKKLQDAKGNKEALASIQGELNSTIGKTPGLLNEESDAYNIANQKIDDRIKRLKELRKLELEDKVTAQKEIFNNTLVDNAMGIDHKFDYFADHKIVASDTLNSEFNEYLEGVNTNKFETLQSIFDALKKNGYGNGKKSNAKIWKELIDSYGGAMLDVEEIQNYFDNQTEYAQKILSDYVNNTESIFSKEEINSIIESLVESGYSQDLEGIKSIITSLVENNELEKTINDYYESLYNDDIDSDSLYQNIKNQFDTLVANYPELKGILESYFNSIGKDIETGINNISQNTDKTDIEFSNILALKTSDDKEDDKATTLSKLKDEVDKITSSYKSLKNALNEYRTTGAVSLSTLEELMEAGDDWLNYLSVEDGQLKINEQAYHDMAQAKLYELKVQALQNLSNQVKSLENVASAQKWIESQNYNTADSYKTLTDSIVQETLAELEAKKLSSKSDNEKTKWQEAIDSYKQQANAIIEITSMVSDNASSVSDALTNAKQTADLINTVTKEIQENGKISVSTLQSISSTYPVLEKYVMDYMAGVKGSETELVNQLNKLYAQDVNNYKEAWLLKAQDDKIFWVDFQNNAAETVNKFADQYGIDLKNFDSYAQAKIALSEKIQKALVKVLEADNYVNQKTNSNDITKSAEVAGLTSDQKRNAENLWIKWKNEYLDAKMNGEEYSITEDQMARILERSGGLNNGSAKQLAQTLYTNLVHLSIDSGRSYYDSLIEESKNLESAFDQYSAQYTDKASVAINDPSEFNSSSKETFDWIETEISRLTKALDTLKTKADNTYASWTSRNTALSQAISKTEELIRKQSQAYSRYMQEANSVALSSHYKNLVQNGAMDISTITDETLKEKIKEYQTW